MWTYELTIVIIFIGFPVAVCLSGYSLLRSFEAHSPRRNLLCAKFTSGVAFLFLAYWFLAVDPQNVMVWFLD